MTTTEYVDSHLLVKNPCSSLAEGRGDGGDDGPRCALQIFSVGKLGDLCRRKPRMKKAGIWMWDVGLRGSPPPSPCIHMYIHTPYSVSASMDVWADTDYLLNVQIASRERALGHKNVNRRDGFFFFFFVSGSH